MWVILLAFLAAMVVSPAAAQVTGPVYITPPKPIASIEFLDEAGVERWEVNLSGEKFPTGKSYLRISGTSCTHMGEIYKGIRQAYKALLIWAKTDNLFSIKIHLTVLMRVLYLGQGV